MRFRTIAASVCIVASVSLAVEHASAFAPPVSAVGLATLAGTAAAAPYLATSAAVGASMLAPVGFAALGVAVLAAVLVSSDTQNGSAPELHVSTRDNSTDVNPDYVISYPDTHHTMYWGWGSNLPSAAAADGLQPMLQSADFFNATKYAHLTLPANATAADLAYRMDELASCEAANYCRWNQSAEVYSEMYLLWVKNGRLYFSRSAVPTQTRIGNYVIATARRDSYYSTLIRVVNPVCAGGFSFDTTTFTCISTPTVKDNVCRVAWDSATGCPVVNVFDPDCGAFGLKTSCGDSASPASVTGTDSTGRQLNVQRSTKTYKLPGGDDVVIVDSTPNPASNTTTKTVTNLKPAAAPGAAPTIVGTTTTTLPGTGTAVGTNPVQQVTVTNWPTSLTNPTGNTGTSTPVNFPDRMKIDGEAPAGTPTDLPDATAGAAALPSTTTLLDPLQRRLAGFLNVQVPQHTGVCPPLRIDVDAAGLRIHQSSTAHCDYLDSNRQLIGNLMRFCYLLGAVMLILAA